MIRTRTVLVLGAGASAHLDFPLGRRLKNDVCRDLLEDKPTQLYTVLRDCGREHEELRDFALKLRRSRQPSIDFFVEPDAHRDLRPLAKEAIAAALIPFEDENKLDTNPGWYEYLFNRIGNRLEHLQSSRVSLVTFNYDRSIDRFFLTTFATAFGITESKARELMEACLPINHINGQLGQLPPFGDDGTFHREYSTHLDATTVQACAKGIKILSDHDRASVETMAWSRSFLDNAKIIVFLGFGYHQTNLERILSEQHRQKQGSVEIFGTAKDVFDGERPDIVTMIPDIQLAHEQWDVLTALQRLRILRS